MLDREAPEPTHSWSHVFSMTTLGYMMQNVFSRFIDEYTESRRGSRCISQGHVQGQLAPELGSCT